MMRRCACEIGKISHAYRHVEIPAGECHRAGGAAWYATKASKAQNKAKKQQEIVKKQQAAKRAEEKAKASGQPRFVPNLEDEPSEPFPIKDKGHAVYVKGARNVSVLR